MPFLMQWKGHWPAGRVYEHPVISLDLHPTALAAAGKPFPIATQLDGVNLLPYLMGEGLMPPHERLYWRMGPEKALREGDWKMIGRNPSPRLYNLREDIGEANNLAARYPRKLRGLQAAYAAWDVQLAEPLW